MHAKLRTRLASLVAIALLIALAACSGGGGGGYSAPGPQPLPTTTSAPTHTPVPVPSATSTPSASAPTPSPVPSPTASAGTTPSVQDAMSGPWPSVSGAPDDGIFHIDGNWSVPYGGAQPVQLLQANATFTGPKSTLQLTVPAAVYQGAEIATDAGWTSTSPKGYGYGYYEVSMETANVGDAPSNTGVVNSFFLKGAPCCGLQEIDFEFLTNETWLASSTGAVHCTIDYPGGSISEKVSLPFNPSRALHTYGILWTPDGSVKFYADRTLIDTEANAAMVLPADGVLVMANAWTGNPNWGGLPPAANAVATYASVKYWANVTSLP